MTPPTTPAGTDGGDIYCSSDSGTHIETLTADGERAVARFTDIAIQDGSFFAIKPALAETFPGRFTLLEPAAVEVHATYSGFADDVSHVALAPDAHAKRPFLSGATDASVFASLHCRGAIPR